MRTMSGQWMGALLFGLAMTASVTESAEAADPLAGSEWRPVELGGEEIPETAKAFVQFRDEGQMGGHAGCNRFFGTYTVDSEAITMGPFGATRMMCDESAMALEAELFAALEAAKSFQRDKVVLELHDGDGNPVARFAQTDWD